MRYVNPNPKIPTTVEEGKDETGDIKVWSLHKTLLHLYKENDTENNSSSSCWSVSSSSSSDDEEDMELDKDDIEASKADEKKKTEASKADEKKKTEASKTDEKKKTEASKTDEQKKTEASKTDEKRKGILERVMVDLKKRSQQWAERRKEAEIQKKDIELKIHNEQWKIAHLKSLGGESSMFHDENSEVAQEEEDDVMDTVDRQDTRKKEEDVYSVDFSEVAKTSLINALDKMREDIVGVLQTQNRLLEQLASALVAVHQERGSKRQAETPGSPQKRVRWDLSHYRR